jgi:Resolvase, N terminal domain
LVAAHILFSCLPVHFLLVTKLDRLARSTSDLYRVVSQLAEKDVQFKVLDDPAIATSSHTGKLVRGILALGGAAVDSSGGAASQNFARCKHLSGRSRAA